MDEDTSGNETIITGSIFANEDEQTIPTSPSYTINQYIRSKTVLNYPDIAEFNIRLIGHHSLWSHCLWNAGIALANHFDMDPEITLNKNVIELGTGAGLPSFISVLNGANLCIMTEYPEIELIDNLNFNIQHNLPMSLRSKIVAKGHRWGDKDTLSGLLALTDNNRGYDIIILSDLLFNHSQHRSLLFSCQTLLSKKPESEIYCVFSHHRPHLAYKDLQFFDIARDEFNFEVIFLKSESYAPMFEKDLGDPIVRSLVHFYKLKSKVK